MNERWSRWIGIAAVGLLVAVSLRRPVQAECPPPGSNGQKFECTPFTMMEFSEPPDSQRMVCTNPHLDPGFTAEVSTAPEVSMRFATRSPSPAQTFVLSGNPVALGRVTPEVRRAKVSRPPMAPFGVVSLSSSAKRAGYVVRATRPVGSTGPVHVALYDHGTLVREGSFPTGGELTRLAALPAGFKVRAVSPNTLSYTWVLDPPQAVKIGGPLEPVGTGDELRILIHGATGDPAARSACEFVAHATDTLFAWSVPPARETPHSGLEGKH